MDEKKILEYRVPAIEVELNYKKEGEEVVRILFESKREVSVEELTGALALIIDGANNHFEETDLSKTTVAEE